MIVSVDVSLENLIPVLSRYELIFTGLKMPQSHSGLGPGGVLTKGQAVLRILGRGSGRSEVTVH